MPKATIYKLPQRYMIVVTDNEGKVLGYDFGRSNFAANDKITNYDPKGQVKVEQGEVAKDFPLYVGAPKRSKKQFGA